jgi:hypothetical protein
VLDLEVLPDRLAVCRLPPGETVPSWALESRFFSVTRTERELSIVCAEARVPSGTQAERGFRALEVQGSLDFSLIGILTSLLDPLAEAGISVFAVSTYDTDYMLVRQEALARAIAALRGASHRVADSDTL